MTEYRATELREKLEADIWAGSDRMQGKWTKLDGFCHKGKRKKGSE